MALGCNYKLQEERKTLIHNFGKDLSVEQLSIADSKKQKKLYCFLCKVACIHKLYATSPRLTDVLKATYFMHF